MLRRLTLCLLPLLCACDSKPDSAADGGGAPHADALCDGSSELRLVYTSQGGFPADFVEFTNPHGYVFVAIDGMCRYYASDNYMLGIHTGTLEGSEAEAFARELHWQELGSWQWGIQQDQSCPDASAEILMREHVAAACSCGCDASAPKGLADALQSAQTWLARLMSEGAALDGPVSALARETTKTAVREPLLDWPLPRAIDAIADLVHTTIRGPYARFDGDDATKLRALRSAALKGASSTPSNAFVRDGDKVYELYVRDELPEATVEAWDALAKP